MNEPDERPLLADRDDLGGNPGPGRREFGRDAGHRYRAGVLSQLLEDASGGPKGKDFEHRVLEVDIVRLR